MRWIQLSDVWVVSVDIHFFSSQAYRKYFLMRPTHKQTAKRRWEHFGAAREATFSPIVLRFHAHTRSGTPLLLGQQQRWPHGRLTLDTRLVVYRVLPSFIYFFLTQPKSIVVPWILLRALNIFVSPARSLVGLMHSLFGLRFYRVLLGFTGSFA